MFQTDGKKDENIGHNGDGNNGIDHPEDGKTSLEMAMVEGNRKGVNYMLEENT